MRESLGYDKFGESHDCDFCLLLLITILSVAKEARKLGTQAKKKTEYTLWILVIPFLQDKLLFNPISYGLFTPVRSPEVLLCVTLLLLVLEGLILLIPGEREQAFYTLKLVLGASRCEAILSYS